MQQNIQLEGDVPLALFGKRLDQILAQMYPDYSRSKIKEWILNGNVTVNGELAEVPREKLKGGEKIEINAVLEEQVTFAPEDIDLNIVYEDDDLLIINKPADLVVHPGAGNSEGTLLNALLNHNPDQVNLPRAGIVHRLDKDTTGLMVVAKTLQAYTFLVEKLQMREIQRQYEAVVFGQLVSGGYVDEPIGRHPTKRTSMAVVTSGKPALTHYRLIEKLRSHTYLRLKLESGRTHQIRVHMAHIKHPIVGDPLYGKIRLPKGASDGLIETLRGFKRQALHAVHLALPHPKTEEWMSWDAPLPDDFVALLDALRRDTAEHGMPE